MDYKELIERLRLCDQPNKDWPLMIEAANAIESMLAENERLNHNLTSTEQTMREYQELAAKRLEEIAKYRDAPIAVYGVLEDQGSSVLRRLWDVKLDAVGVGSLVVLVNANGTH